MTMRLLRAFALLIASAAALDPAITSTRRARPLISVVPSDSMVDGPEGARVTRVLAESFTIVPAALSSAAGTVIVGNRLPRVTDQLAGPVFAVMPDRPARAVTLESLSAPARAPVESRVPVKAMLRASGAAGETLTVTLRTGELVVDRVRQAITADETSLSVPLSFVPAATGAVHLRVSAELAGAETSAADLVVHAVQKRWAVLFFDARPSWLSRFVRRAIESDARFTVSSRVITSRSISTSSGRAPGALASAANLAPFDAIVVGAPETLSERDIAGLNTFMRQYGGGVVLLLDHQASGPFEQLTQVARWQNLVANRSSAIAATGDSIALHAAQVMWPATLPEGARALARDSAGRPVLWQSVAGAGRLVVSGALDTWKFRDASVSGFDAFWQALIAATADHVPAALDVRLEQSMLAPGEASNIVVTVRAAALADLRAGRPVHASATATLETQEGNLHVRLWPDGAAGVLRGELRAPTVPGTYNVAVEVGGSIATVPIVVVAGRQTPAPAEQDLLETFATAHGGRAVRTAQMDQLASALLETLKPVPRRETWHPMRSPWWIVPFAFALGMEWFVARRRRDSVAV